MARYLIIPLLLVSALAVLLIYIGGQETVSINMLGKVFETKLQFAIVLLVLAVIAVIALWSLGLWLWRLPRRVKKSIHRKKEANGLEAVEDALIAGEAGDSERARKKAARANELLGRPALTALVSAKAAEACGDMEAARMHYNALLNSPRTQTAGQRGLARIADHVGDDENLVETAMAAYADSKSPVWAFDHLFAAQCAREDWDGALETLATGEKRKHIAKDAARRRRAVLLCAKAASINTDNGAAHNLALETALKAAETSPGFAPASALAARLLTQSGQTKKAANLLEKAWARNPHPALALAYRDVFAGQSDSDKAKRLKALIKANPAHRESFILAAEEALAQGNGVDALSALGSLLDEEEPSARLCALAAAAEERLGNPVDARAWRIRAASAPTEPLWSDLDPDGPAFAYTPEDWKRLVISYGDSGEMIHPRLDANKKSRAYLPAMAAPQDEPKQAAKEADTPADGDIAAKKDAPVPTDTQSGAPEKTPLKDNSSAPSPDDPGVVDAEGGREDLASRLDKLLGTKP